MTNENNTAAATLRPEVAAKVAEHYEHARRKHPYFADGLFLEGNNECAAAHTLMKTRFCLHAEKNICKEVLAETVLNCEIVEAAHAYAVGDKAHAVEEVYDAIAVLLRIVDVIELRQTLGNPDGGGEIDEEDDPKITCQWCGRIWGENETSCPQCGEKREAYENENAKEAKEAK